NLLYEIIAGLRSTSSDSASSSLIQPGSAPTKSVSELLCEIGPVNIVDDALPDDGALVCDFPLQLQDKTNDQQNEECCSFTSSNRGSWGRCSSLGGSDEEPSATCPTSNNHHQNALDVLATPLHTFRQVLPKSPKDGKKKKKKKKQKSQTNPEKPKREKFEKLEALSRRLRLCILKRINHQRHRSS
ncbi:hypothetical protein CRG98_018021, partial [Punica granatum]